MKVRLLLLTIISFSCGRLSAQGIQRDVTLTNLSTTRNGFQEYQLGNFSGHKVLIGAKKGYLSQIPEGLDGEELKLIIYPDQPMRIAHNAYPYSRQNIFTKSTKDISIPELGWTSVSFIYDSTLLGGSWLLEKISTAREEEIVVEKTIVKKTVSGKVAQKVMEGKPAISGGNGLLGIFRNQNGAEIGYIHSGGSGLPSEVTVRNKFDVHLSGIEQGVNGQEITLILNRGKGFWSMLHDYNSTYCYQCASTAGFIPKLPSAIKPLLLENDADANFYKSRNGMATLVYDESLNGGVWKLVDWRTFP